MALLLGSLTLFASWLAPGHYYPWINFQNEWLAVVAGLFVDLFPPTSTRR